ncbi:hypothetical protein DUNSADRAFT_9256 [Dunaliella salina]|uniref:KOW domain-containing protein n=1 Tax=Dunaliella salina TaxID=3046 RepID=A0ABQ7GHU4_DUNSA|nr:hypothetical protein DUNSADRAFT_9256 [Dunaliella salina]|eukprot:KAF5834181.1 hypothetical protein DUNSADRAFT_9256 [Dunaliella salina]
MSKAYRSIKPMFPRSRWRIVEGDEVVVRGTQFSGQIGKVLAVLRDVRVPQVVVEGVNLRKKQIPIGESEEDMLVVTMEHPIHYSNVNLIEPATTSSEDAQGSQLSRRSWPGVRAKFRYDQNGERVRIGKGRYAAGRIIPWPTPIEEKPVQGGIKDTDVTEAERRTREQDDFQALLSAGGQHNAWSHSTTSSAPRSSTQQGGPGGDNSSGGEGGNNPDFSPSSSSHAEQPSGPAGRPGLHGGNLRSLTPPQGSMPFSTVSPVSCSLSPDARPHGHSQGGKPVALRAPASMCGCRAANVLPLQCYGSFAAYGLAFASLPRAHLMHCCRRV